MRMQTRKAPRRAPTRGKKAKGGENGIPDSVDVDPYFEWALGSGKDTYFPPDQQVWVPVLLRLQGITVAEFAEGKVFFGSESPERVTLYQQRVKVLDVYLEPPDENENYIVTMAAYGYFTELLRTNETFASKIAELELGLPLDQQSLGPAYPVEPRRQEPRP